MRVRAVLIILILLLIPAVVTAQTPTPTPGTQPEVVQVTATDGLTLVGYYFAQSTAAVGNPAVLLLHQIGVDARV
jgi:hypothetical protein